MSAARPGTRQDARGQEDIIPAAEYLNVRTGARWPLRPALSVAPDDGGYVNLTAGDGIARDAIDQARPGLWRYAAAIRLPDVHAVRSLGEGFTPLLPWRWDGAEIALKCEHLMPSGSFKDRGVAVLLNYLAQAGITAFLEDTSGNTGASMASYAALLGLSATIVMPDSAPLAKRVHPRFMGARVIEVAGGRQAAADRVEQEKRHLFYAGHNWQPFFLEGILTVAFEIWEQLGFAAPDVVITPLGQGSNLMGLRNGFQEQFARGEIDRVPILYGIQAANCAPYAAALRAGGAVPAGWSAEPTIADGIATQVPVRLPDVLAAATASGGDLVTVSEAEIVAAWRAAATHGLFVEPTGAVGLAGLSRLLRDDRVRGSDRIVVLTTGTGLKAIERAQAHLAGVGVAEAERANEGHAR